MALDGMLMKGKVLKFLRENPDYSIARLESLYASAKAVHGVRVADGVLVCESTQQHIVRAEDVVWVYIQQQDIRVNFIPMGKPSCVHIWLQQGTCITVGTMTMKRSVELLKHLIPLLPCAYFGHSQELVELWNAAKPGRAETFRQLAALQRLKE